jgi:hypothetical protein
MVAPNDTVTENAMVLASQNQNYNRPSQGMVPQTVPQANASMVPNLAAPYMPPTQEQRLGQPNFYVQGMSRVVSPEDANADFATLPAQVYHESAMLQLPPVFFLQGRGSIVRADYNILANQQYLRGGGDVLGALGRNDQVENIGAQVGGTGQFLIEAPAPPNLVFGFILEWSTQFQISAPFTMSIITERFKGLSWQTLDRTIALRIGGQMGGGGDANANGGIIAVLFAQRLSTTDTCGWAGGGGSSTPASGGMFKAVAQPAWVTPGFDSADPDFPFIPATTVDMDDAPEVSVTVPLTIASGFSVLARYISAASPQLANVREAALYS